MLKVEKAVNQTAGLTTVSKKVNCALLLGVREADDKQCAYFSNYLLFSHFLDTKITPDSGTWTKVSKIRKKVPKVIKSKRRERDLLDLERRQ